MIKDNTISHNEYAGIWLRERARGRIELNRLMHNGLTPIKAAPADGCEFVTRMNQGA